MKKKLTVLLAVAALVCAIFAVRDFVKEKNAGASYQALQQQVVQGGAEEASSAPAPKPSPVEEPASSSVAGPDAATGQHVIDFDTLRQQAPEAYAWVRIPGTDIDFPVVQSATDNAYYLTHTAQQEEKFEGAIFTENYNKKDFSDPMTVLYGHNMRNKSMFGSLHDFEDRSFFEAHPEIMIYTPNETRTYRIFAAYTADDRHILLNNDFSDPQVWNTYFQDLFQRKSASAHIDDAVQPEVGDHVLTLSTCTGTDTTRYLVQAVLEK